MSIQQSRGAQKKQSGRHAPARVGNEWEQQKRRNNGRNKVMQLKVLVTSDRRDEYVGKKGLVKNQVITC
jgi:hypothetical protein